MARDKAEHRVRTGKAWVLGRTVRRIRVLGSLLWPFARGHRGRLVSGALLSAGLILLRLAQPWPLKWAVDALSGSHRDAWYAGSDLFGAVLLLSGLYLLVSLLAALAEYWQQLVLTGLGNRILYDFRSHLFAHLLRLPLAYHTQRTIGELVTRIVSDTARLRRGVNGMLVRVLQVTCLFAGTVVVLFVLSWPLALIVAIFGAVTLLIMSGSGRRILLASRKLRKREGRLASVVAEDLLGIRELQSFRGESPRDQRFAERNTKSLKEEQKVRRMGARLLMRVEGLFAFTICLLIFFGAAAVRDGALSLGTFVLFIHYAAGLYGPFRQFAQQAARTGRTVACAQRLIKIAQEPPAISSLPSAVPLRGAPEAIALEHVWVRSSRRHRIRRKFLLEDVSFSVRKGERVGIIGTNGAGKSTLLRLILRLADPQEGRVTFDGNDLRAFTVDSVRDRCSVVFQEPVFFGLTVRENIAFGSPAATDADVERAASSVGIDGWIAALPKGYDSVVNRQGTLLSGGERQKLALARAVVRGGDLWLLDEPLTGLDAGSRAALLDELVKLTEGRTTFWVTHDGEVLPFFHRLLVLREGCVRFDGDYREYERWAAGEGERAEVAAGRSAEGGT